MLRMVNGQIDDDQHRDSDDCHEDKLQAHAFEKLSAIQKSCYSPVLSRARLASLHVAGAARLNRADALE
jgi:hypothetical protein